MELLSNLTTPCHLSVELISFPIMEQSMMEVGVDLELPTLLPIFTFKYTSTGANSQVSLKNLPIQ